MVKAKNKPADTVSAAEVRRLNSRLQQTPIAVVGMASVFADAKNLNQYWDNIMEKINSIIDVPASRWNIDDYYSANKNEPDKTYCKRGAFIPDLDFDPMEFGLPPNILEVTDIAQLLALVVARDVIEDAGIGDGTGYDRDKVGVILGVGGGLKQIVPLTSRLQYPVLEKVLTSCGVEEKDKQVIIEKFKKAYINWEENSFPGMLGNVIAGRIANRFDLGGTNCVVDAACAGSLAAMRMAVSDLLEYRSEVMISGGICCDNSPFMYMSFSKTPAFTTNDDIRPFDENSKGMMVGEGIGMIAMKRLEDAERDGDRIYAVLKGIGTSSDGRFKSIYAPRPDGQAKALKRAYEDAGFDPRTVGLIEAHGTGTLAGDAAEFSGLNKFFGEQGAAAEKDSIALGSVKSQIGHTKSAAGSAGFIKVCLALHHKVLPASINVDKPSPTLDIEQTPFYINTETRPWLPRQDGAPRRAGVSSFGFGGTNFHFVLEEYKAEQSGAYRLNPVAQMLLLTAADEAQLVQLLQSERAQLQVDADEQPFAFNRFAARYALATPEDKKARVGFVAANAQDASDLLDKAIAQFAAKAGADQWTLPAGIYYRRKGFAACGKTVALFSGQGSQYVNMGRDLACNFPPLRQAFAAMDSEFSANGLTQLSRHVFPVPVFNEQDRAKQETTLQLTQHAQPAIGTFSMGLYQLFKQAGFSANFTAGHSFGELTALWAAGVLNDADYLMLARARGQAMAAPDDASFDAGTMIAVVGDPSAVASDIKGIDQVSIANYNSNNQVVVAGATAQVLAAFDTLKDKGYKVVKLPVSAAFHTPLVGHAQKPFAAAIEQATFNKPLIPVFANGTGKAHSEKPADIKKVMKNHILESVRFKDEIDNVYAAGGRVFIEFGPKNVLTKLVENILADKDDVIAIALNANPKKSADVQLRQAAVQMAVNGVLLNNPDSYAAPLLLEGRKKSPMAMKLSAASYVSDKTRKTFEDALNDGYTISKAAGEPQVVEKIVEKVVERIVEVPVASAAGAVSTASNADAFLAQQQQLLNVHEKFMQGPAEYNKTVQQVLAQNNGQLPGAVEKTLNQYHDFQTETLRVHEQYLTIQTQYLTGSVQPLASAPVAKTTVVSAPVVSTPVAAPAQAAVVTAAPAQVSAPVVPVAVAAKPVAPVVAEPVTATVAATAAPAAIDTAKIQNVMLNVVAEKTGYPAEMLELGMDMEADLGIDSIKRVEILGAVQDQIDNLPELNPEDLAELRTLGQIVDYMQSKAGAAPASAVVSAPVAQASVATAAVDTARIQQVMMSVVAEKTGYPAEMLELGMDMEADLGIDSIKRVEILGAVQDQIDNLPELNPEDLAELRTLGQIVDYMQSKASAAAPVSAVVSAPVAQATSKAAVDTARIQQVMMSVVAEKTGYPADMLELGMDMEADLGIDSIKRVEILGAVQDQIDNLPELNPEDLAELRTLGQIVDYMQSKAGAAAPVSTAVSAPLTQAAPKAAVDTARIQQVMMSVVADKTGYPAEMLELGMDMEADLGIDSIKRVEILGAVQDQIDNLPELNPEDLAELRTLGQIVSYMQQKSGAAQVQPAVAPSAAVSQVKPAGRAIDATAFAQTLMQVVAEKTGYPVEMLELDMDMEADLGIDSIKRVEILGAAQDAMPGLPEVSPETLAEMRSLREIVEVFTANTAAAATPVLSKSISEKAPSATVVIERLQAPLLVNNTGKGSNCLLVSDGTAVTQAIAEKLLAAGWQLTIAQPAWVKTTAKKSLPKAASVQSIADASEDAVSALVAQCGQLDAVVYLHHAKAVSGIEYPQASKNGLMLAFLLAKYSKLREAKQARASFVVLTRQGGQLGFNEQNADLVQGGLNGLVKTLAQEWPQVFCRAVDVADSQDAASTADKLWQEIMDADTRLNEVAYDAQGRLTLAAALTDSYSLPAGNSINSDSVFLVSGGAKGVTAHCVVRLAQQYNSTFILLGRSAFNEQEPAWAKGISDNAALKKSAMEYLLANGEKPTPVKVQQFIQPVLSSRDISDTLQRIRAAGGKAHYLAADVTDSKALQAAVKALAKTTGAVTGIIHGAGVLADKLIEQKTLSEFESVYRTKIDGLTAMLSCVDAKKLKQLVLFSSAAGFYGNPAQSDYSMANEILNKTALRFKNLHPHTQVLSFNWGPWDGGMVTPELKRMFTERGVYIIPLDAGAELMLNELAADTNRCPQILVGNDMSGAGAVQESAIVKKPEVSRLVKVIQAADNAFLQDHVIGTHAVLPTVCALAWMKQAALQLYPGWHCQQVSDYRLFKGIVFDGTEPAHCIIELTPVNTNAGSLQLDARIFSTNSAGKPVFHYAATLQLTDKPLVAPLFNGTLSHCAGKEATYLYQNGTLFHGEHLQGIQQLLRCDQQGLQLRCRIGEHTVQAAGEFALQHSNIFANDLVYQAMLVWVREQLGMGSLPSSTGRWISYREVAEGEVFDVLLTVTQSSKSQTKASLQLIDNNGLLIADITDACVTASDNLKNLFKPAA